MLRNGGDESQRYAPKQHQGTDKNNRFLAASRNPRAACAAQRTLQPPRTTFKEDRGDRMGSGGSQQVLRLTEERHGRGQGCHFEVQWCTSSGSILAVDRRRREKGEDAPARLREK